MSGQAIEAALNGVNEGIIAATALTCIAIVRYYGRASLRLVRIGRVRADDQTLGEGAGAIFAGVGYLSAAFGKLFWVTTAASPVPYTLLPVFILSNMGFWYGFTAWLAQRARHRSDNDIEAGRTVLRCWSVMLIIFIAVGIGAHQ